MGLNLALFSDPITAIVPILNGKFLLNGKKYSKGSDNGWFKVEINGNKFKIIENFIPVYGFPNYAYISGYILNDQFIFQNFDVGRKKTGKEILTNIYFNNCASLSPSIAVIWEDGNLYYYDVNYIDSFGFTIKSMIDSNTDLSTVKGITPEIRTLCLFYHLEQQKLEELKKEKEVNEFKKTFQGRLLLSFKRVGAELLKYSITANRLTVDWSIGNQEFNSVLDVNTFRVIEAGYCMSGHDKEHSLHSMVNLAKDYDERGLIYKTRE